MTHLLLAMAVMTMRVDYYHTGNSKQELFSIDRIQIEPLPWPGDMSKTIDDSNLGKYFFEVRDRASKRLLYSRGFASIFGEWETTEEATTMMRTFSESLRFPAPVAATSRLPSACWAKTRRIFRRCASSRRHSRRAWRRDADP